MNVWITANGSRGDIFPFLAVGRSLQRRGHAVAFAAPHYFRRDIEAAGLEFSDIGNAFDVDAVLHDPKLMSRNRGGLVVLRSVLAAAPETIPRVRAVLEERRPDVVLANHLCIGTEWVCRELGIPFARGTVMPIMWLSTSDPVPLMQRSAGRLNALVARLMFPALRTAVAVGLSRSFNRLRKRCGYPRVSNAYVREMIEADASLGLWSPIVRAATPGDPPRSTICGYPWYDGSGDAPRLAPELDAFLSAGPPPVVFSLGTTAVHAPGEFYELAAQACQKLGVRGVLVAGDERNRPAHLPAGVIAVKYAPFLLLLPRANAVVHQCGIGSVGLVLRAGRPMVGVPHGHDQFHNALLAERLGTATIVARHRLTFDRLCTALNRVLAEPAFAARAAELGPQLSTEDGGATAAATLEALVSRRPNVTGARSSVP